MREYVAKSHNVEKKTLKTTKNINKKKFVLPPVTSRSPPPSTYKTGNQYEEEGSSLSEIYALT